MTFSRFSKVFGVLHCYVSMQSLPLFQQVSLVDKGIKINLIIPNSKWALQKRNLSFGEWLYQYKPLLNFASWCSKIGQHLLWPLKNKAVWHQQKRKQKKREAYNTWYSQAVTHPSTNQAHSCLTSVIRRELVYSARYGRRHWQARDKDSL